MDRLPKVLVQDLLRRLPISSIAVCTSVSRSWLSTILEEIWDADFAAWYSGKRDDVVFLIFSDTRRQGHAIAYNPSKDSWFEFPLPLPIPPINVSCSSLLLSQHTDGRITISNPFSNMNPEQQIPHRTGSEEIPSLEVYALIQTTATEYKILVINNGEILYYQIYDSENLRWNPLRLFPHSFPVLERAVCLNGLLYCLARVPYCFLTFDHLSEHWTILNIDMPADFMVWPHLFVFEGDLFMVAGIEEALEICRIGIWSLDQTILTWRFIVFIPDPYFSEFSKVGLRRFHIVERLGLIFFYNCSSRTTLMCDFSKMCWWSPKPCAADTKNWMWLGQAIQPSIGLLK